MPANVVAALENWNLPFINYILGFVFTLVIAFFLNNISRQEFIFNLPAEQVLINFTHYMLSNITWAVLFILILNYITRVPVKCVMKVVMPGYILSWIKPFVDLTTTGGNPVNTGYLVPGSGTIDIFHFFLTGNPVASIGAKCLVISFLFCVIAYFRVKKLNWVFCAIYTVLIYAMIVLWSAVPLFINALMKLTGYSFVFSTEMMIHFYLVALFLFGMMTAYLANPEMFLLFARDVRALRMTHYELMLFLGAALALGESAYDVLPQLYFSEDIVINIVLCMISLLFSGLFAIVVNNLSDIEIDRISNADRPLIRNVIDVKSYLSFGFCFMALALFYSAMVNSKALLVMSLFMGSYYVYSSPPLRLKRIIVFSKLAISLNSLALVMLGYLLVRKSVDGFPESLYWIFLIGFTLSANFIDLKDVKGDSAAGIITLPVLFGDKKAKIMIGTAFWLTYLALFYIVDNIYLIVPLVLGGGLQFYLINRKPYNEFLVLLFHNLSLVALIVYLMMIKIYFPQ
jgi:4-hydroxybenzoate polyprenyltransferase